MITQDAYRQAECLRLIAAHFKAWGESPTLTEIATKMDIDKVTVHLLVKKLAADKLVKIVPGTWRNIRITATGAAIAADPQSKFHTVAAHQIRKDVESGV